MGLVGGILRQLSCFLPHKGCFSTSCLRERELMGWQRPRPVPSLELVALTPGFVKALVRPLCIQGRIQHKSF